jgi:hypothetical protein
MSLEALLMFYGLAPQWRDVADCFEEIEQQLAAKPYRLRRSTI